MLRSLAILFCTACFTAPLSAQETNSPNLRFPLACTLGTDCWIARYPFRAGTQQDYRCGTRTQKGHKGTDFALKSLAHMKTGVKVLAAAPGTVKGTRDGMPDISIKKLGAEAVKGKECGNGVVLAHAGGWETQYCHMKKGSLNVKTGDHVTAGTVLGEVGLSGKTEYPHLHISLRKDGKPADPFDGRAISQACSKSGNAPLWETAIPYAATSLVSVTLTPTPPQRQDIWQAAPENLPSNAPSLVLTGRVFGVEAGDAWHFKITRPDGRVFFENSKRFKKATQFHYQYGGRKRPAGGFMKGLWQGEITVNRDGEKLAHQQTSLLVE